MRAGSCPLDNLDAGIDIGDPRRHGDGARLAFGGRIVTNLVIANAITNSVDQTILERAYEAACDELQKKHNINHAALAELIDPITGALLDLYGVGQRD